MMPFEPLWADIGQIITAMVVIFFIVISIIGNIIAKLNEQKAKARRRGGGAQRPQQPRQQAGAGGGGGIEDEITDFLRRAAQGEAAEPQRPPPPPRPQPRALEPIQAEVVSDPRRRAVGEGIDTSKFERSAELLGDDVVEAEQQFDEHLHDTFDHGVSELSDSRGSLAPLSDTEPKRRAKVPPAAAAGFAAMLANADNIRQAIIITEILNRPEDRWQ